MKRNQIKNTNSNDSNDSNEEISEDSETNENENENENQNEIENENQNENEIDLIEIKNENQSIFKEKFINDFQNLFENENNNYSDFIIKSGKESFQFNSHKSILSFRSPYFALLFKEKSINQIEFPEIRTSIMKKILEYIYTSKIQISKSELIEMWIVSNQFQLNLLSKFIENEIIKNINEKNVCDYLSTNQKMKSKRLENECLKFVINNFDNFIQQNNTFKLTKKQMKYVIEKGTIKFKKIGIELFEMIEKWIKENEQKNNDEINQKEKFNKIIEKFIPKINIKCLKNKTLKQIKKIEFLPNIFLIGIENLRNERIYQKQKKQQIVENLRNEKDEIIQKQKKEIEKEKKENQELTKENERMKSIYEEEKKLNKIFEESQIIKEIEFMKKLKEWIQNEEFFNKMKIGFSCQKDGFSSQKFHSKCDNKGKTLIIIQTTNKYIFGGFTEIGFISGSDRYIKDPNAFIFSLKNPKNNIPQKFKIQKGKEDYAIAYYKNGGPKFGEYKEQNEYYRDIYINSDLKSGNTDFGATYSLPNGLRHGTSEAKSYLAGSYKDWKIEEMEIYFV